VSLIILKWKNWLQKVRRIHKNGAQNWQVTRAEFSIFLVQNSDNPNLNRKQ